MRATLEKACDYMHQADLEAALKVIKKNRKYFKKDSINYYIYAYYELMGKWHNDYSYLDSKDFKKLIKKGEEENYQYETFYGAAITYYDWNSDYKKVHDYCDSILGLDSLTFYNDSCKRSYFGQIQLLSEWHRSISDGSKLPLDRLVEMSPQDIVSPEDFLYPVLYSLHNGEVYFSEEERRKLWYFVQDVTDHFDTSLVENCASRALLMYTYSILVMSNCDRKDFDDKALRQVESKLRKYFDEDCMEECSGNWERSRIYLAKIYMDFWNKGYFLDTLEEACKNGDQQACEDYYKGKAREDALWDKHEFFREAYEEEEE